MPELVGIARLAAESPLVEAKRRVEYFELPTRSYITYCASPRVPFHWTVNPYRGCEFGCKYCYARYAHEFMELRDPLQFERKIFAKRFDAARFREELHKIPRGECIAIGTATDPYQPAERRYRVTRAILEVFANTSGFRVGITTKSDLIARDIDLLGEVARRHYLGVHMTVTTVDRELARLIEPMAPRPDLRIAAVRKLNAAGIRASVFASPVMPLINDSDPSLDAVAKAAARAGARSFGGHVLFLKPCSRAVFLPFLEEHFPLLVRRYKERFERAAYLRGDYPEKIQERIKQIRRRYGFDIKTAPAEPELWLQDAQLTLFS
jgi:DNA repair photolyase